MRALGAEVVFRGSDLDEARESCEEQAAEHGYRYIHCVAAKAVRSSVQVIGVQSEAAPAAYRSWHAGTLVEDSTSTFAEGLATRTAFELPQQIMRDLLDDFVLVSEDSLKAATRLMIEKTRNLAEPAGAAALAAVLDAPERFAGRKVAIICSGGNISPAQLAELWSSAPR